MSAVYNKAKFLGKKIERVEHDKDNLRFFFEDGKKWFLQAEGDCCSYTWIEHLEKPSDADLKGATLLDVFESSPVEDNDGKVDADDDECIQFYLTTFRTSVGDIQVDYRNSSNGYYGGSLETLSTSSL
jgi:hypothetical protein